MTHQGGPSGWPGEILYAAPGSLQPETLRTLEDSGSPAGGSQELHTRPPRSFSALWLNHVLFSPRNPSLTFKAQLTVTPGSFLTSDRARIAVALGSLKTLDPNPSQSRPGF